MGKVFAVNKGLIARFAAAAALAASMVAPLAARAESATGSTVVPAARTQSFENTFDQTLGTVARAPRKYDAFDTQLAALAEGSQGRIGVAALDMATGRTVSVLGDQPFPMASTAKVAIVATFLDGVDKGRFHLSDRYPLMIPVPSRKFDGAVAPVRSGTSLSAENLIELALTRSDNQATDALLAAIGGPQVVTRWVRNTAGIAEFRLDHDIATMVRDDGAVNPATTVDKRDSITPNAMVTLLSGLYRGQWLSPSSRAVLIGTMGRCITGKTRIPSLMPAGTQVAHKTGTLSNTASDVGFIRTPDGRELAVAIYVTGQGSKPDRNARIAMIARGIVDGYNAEGPQERRVPLVSRQTP
jgi:beta-lactamase class A